MSYNAYLGNFPTADAGATAADNQKYGSFNKESIKLTDHINIINFKGMTNFELGQVGRFFREISKDSLLLFLEIC